MALNRVDIEVTGSNKFDATNDAVIKDLKKLETQAGKTSAASKKLKADVETKPKTEGIGAAERAMKKLADAAEEAGKRAKEALEESIKATEKERVAKIKVKLDADRDFSSSLGNLDFGSVDITKGIGPKIAAAFGKGIDATGAGAKSAASFVSGLGDGLKAQHPAVQAAVYGSLVVAALTAAPFVGAVLAGGIIAGFGTGIAGIGVMAAVQSDRVRDTYMNLWDEIVAGTQKRSGVIEVVLLNTAARAKTIFSRMAPEIAGAFDDIAPGVEKLLDGLLQSFERFAPVLRPIAEAASAVFSDLGDRLPDIIGEMADEFGELAAMVRQNPEALGDFLAVVGEGIEIITEFARVLTYMYTGTKQLWDVVSTPLEWVGLKDGEEAAGKTGRAMTELSNVTGDTNGKLKSIEQGFKDLAEAEDDAAKRGDAFLEILNRLNGITPSFDDAMQSANDTIRGLLEDFTKTGAAADGFGKDLLTADGHISTATANGSKLYDAMSSLRESFADMAGATKDLEAAGLSHEAAVNKVNEAVATQGQRLLDAAGKMGLNQDQMRELLRLYGLTPKQIETLLKLDDVNFRDRMLANLRAETKTIHVVYNNINAPLTQGSGRMNAVTDYAHGGNVARAASGGVRHNEIVMNDGPGFPGEAVRLPNGSTVWPAGMTEMMANRASRGMGGGGATLVLKGGAANGLEAVFLAWLKAAVSDNGGDASVFGGG